MQLGLAIPVDGYRKREGGREAQKLHEKRVLMTSNTDLQRRTKERKICCHEPIR